MCDFLVSKTPSNRKSQIIKVFQKMFRAKISHEAGILWWSGQILSPGPTGLR